MKALNKFGVLVATCALMAVAGLGTAHAGQVTVKFKVFPSGPTFDEIIIGPGCDTAKADDFADGDDTYSFLFWDNQGTIDWTKKANICAGSGDTTAIAWYEITGGGGPCPDTGCYITTFAFSIDHNEFLKVGTPIALVSPNSPVVWPGGPPPTSLLNVTTADGPEDVTALSALAFPPHKAEPFRYWQTLPYSPETPETPPGIVYEASQNSSAVVVAFYGPDPCKALEQELANCLASGGGPDGKLNCTGIGHELQLCQKENREVNASQSLAELLKGADQ
jgi:hypothetical protein